MLYDICDIDDLGYGAAVCDIDDLCYGAAVCDIDECYGAAAVVDAHFMVNLVTDSSLHKHLIKPKHESHSSLTLFTLKMSSTYYWCERAHFVKLN